ncbi:AN1-type zinc finger protein 6 (Zinc finger A20 domain-containing protein 3) [Fasciola hepatica]|uniref:AN1-type zinc finger protein 6 (Zinc finger A20 domain-containing protein 3) n=1 Tax=Fasciola hepatica TaxID=6192 RepID=A0A2H1CKL6_FASHE|nr:AN1-type zinc finger protein 6 (Zinc finger A20 domain-containing protein 3) [Fasciola hepatica]
MEDNNQQNIPLLCRKGCGFYGSPNFDGLCSKCHRSAQAQLENAQSGSRASIDSKLSTSDCPGDKLRSEHTYSSDKSVAIKVSAEASTPTPEKGALQSDQSGSQRSQPDDEVTVTSLSDDLLDALKDSKPGSPASSCSSTSTSSKKRPRCDVCHKRVGLTGFTCRCGGLYCSLHRYSDAHSCSFDYRESGQEEIRRSNPQIICQKVQKI